MLNLTIKEQNNKIIDDLSWELDDLLEEDRVDEERWNKFLIEQEQKRKDILNG